MIKTGKYLPSKNLIKNMNANKKVCTKIEISKTELEATMNMRLYELKPETVISIDMKLSTINSNKNISPYEQSSDDLIKRPLLNSTEKIPMHHKSPNIYLTLSLKATPFFIFKNGGMPPFMPSANIYQQTRTGQHANISKQKITTYIPFSSHQTHILNFSQPKKTMNHYQDHS